MNTEVLMGIVGGVEGLDFGPVCSYFHIAQIKHDGNERAKLKSSLRVVYAVLIGNSCGCKERCLG
jgi:hypothetical protein